MIEEPPILTICETFPRITLAQITVFENIPTGYVCNATQSQGAMHNRIQTLFASIGNRAQYTTHGVALIAENGPSGILATMGVLQVLQKATS